MTDEHELDEQDDDLDDIESSNDLEAGDESVEQEFDESADQIGDDDDSDLSDLPHDFTLDFDGLDAPLDVDSLESYSLGNAIWANREGEGDIDIEAALASVASLSDVIAEQEAAESAEYARREESARKVAEESARREAYYLPRPPVLVLQRGQMASVIPALALIGVGAWLTFALTTRDEGETVKSGIFIIAALLGVCASLLAYWLTARRWSRGAAFIALSALFVGGTLYYLAQDNAELGVDGYPLLISAVGAAAFLSALLSQPRDGNQIYTGLLAIVGGIAGLVITTDSLDQNIIDAIKTFGVVAVAIALVLVFAPGLIRRRS
jgi:hypothetical protein